MDILEQHPRPWKTERTASPNYWRLTDANGILVLPVSWMLPRDHAEFIVAAVNSYQAKGE